MPIPPLDARIDPAETRAAAAAEIERRGISNAAAARAMRVDPATLSRFLAGTYEGNVNAIADTVAAWTRVSSDAALWSDAESGLDRHAETGVARRVYAALAYAQARSDIVVVTGPSGRGKSWAARRFAESGGRGVTHICATAALRTISGVLNALSAELGAGTSHASTIAAERAVLDRTRDRNAILVVDEAHHLPDRVLDELRCLRDTGGVGIGLVGDDTLRSAVGRLPQLRGRIGLDVRLRAVPRADAAGIARAVLGRDLADSEDAAVLAAAAEDGGLHVLRRLLALAWTVAVNDGRREIGPTDVEAAHKERIDPS